MRRRTELAASGLMVPAGQDRIDSRRKPPTAAESLGFPVVLKGLGVAHKTEAGAVKLNLASSAEVLEAPRTAWHAVASGYLVEKMIAKPVAELIVGAMRDPGRRPGADHRRRRHSRGIAG